MRPANPLLDRTMGRAAIVSLGVAMFATAVFAQNPTPDLAQMTLEGLMNIEVVSVSKKDQKLAETAAAVYVITREDIRRSGATTVAEVLRLVPGVNVARIDSNGWAVSVRGFNGAYANKLLVLIDGRSVYTPMFSGVHWDEQDVLLEDIDRIEVIRGPGATMWGANAVNGVINILTRNASETKGGLVAAGSGTEEQSFASFRYGGTFSNDVHYRLYGKHSNYNSFKDLNGRNNGDGWNMERAGFRMDWKPRARDAFMVQGEVHDGNTGAPNQSLVSLQPIAYKTQTDQTEASGGHILAQWSRGSGAREMSLKFFHDHKSHQDQLLGERVNMTDVEWQDRISVGSRQDVVWGLGYRNTSDKTRGTLTVGFFPEKFSINRFNGFFQDDIALVQHRLSLTLGAKVEYENEAGQAKHVAYPGFQLEPHAGIMWTPGNKHSVWGAFARALRTPSRADTGLVIRFAAFSGANGAINVLGVRGNPDAEREVMHSYEMGYRFQPVKRLSADIANFYAVYGNLIGTEPGIPFLEETPVRHLLIPTIITNGLRAETYGSEASVNLDVTRRWRLNTGYSLLRAQLHAIPGHAAQESDEGKAPEHQWLIRSSLDLPHGFEIDGAIYHVGRLETFKTPAYSRADLRLAWRAGEHWEFSVTGQNLLKGMHPEFGTSEGKTATEIARSVYAKLTWRF